LVLPSKLTNMLASGRPVIATASAGTGLAHECEGCGLVTEPGDAPALALAIETLLEDPEARARYGEQARHRAEQRWSRVAILARFEGALRDCAQRR
jgi:colanic acid biosynthesis glycosyl transferase WcaI